MALSNEVVHTGITVRDEAVAKVRGEDLLRRSQIICKNGHKASVFDYDLG